VTYVYWMIGAQGGTAEFRTIEAAETFARETMSKLSTIGARCHVRVMDTPALWSHSYSPRAHYVKQEGSREFRLWRGEAIGERAPETVRSPRALAQAAE